MSRWTYILASFSIETRWNREPMKERITEFLKTAPKITGSEGNVNIAVTVFPGDEYHTESATLTLVGNLRDRSKVQTYIEYLNFRFALKEEFYIDMESLDIKDDYDIDKDYLNKKLYGKALKLGSKVIKLCRKTIKMDDETRIDKLKREALIEIWEEAKE